MGARGIFNFHEMENAMRDQNTPGATIKRIYPRIWTIVFLIGGIVSLTGGHVKFMVFGAHVGLHTIMWFAMALAHMDAFWGSGRHRH